MLRTTSTVRTTLRLAVAASIAATVTGLAGCGSSDTSNMPGMDHGSSSAPTASSTTAPSAAATPAAGPHNDADVMFASMMIPHHQQAIEMSDMILAKDGINPQVTELAQQIKAAQAPEIARMSGWLTGRGQNPSPSSMGGMDHDMGDGTMTQAEMDALDKATGTQAGKLFLTGMVKHHQGAIAMAQQELTNGQNSEAEKLAQDIIDAQQAEITTINPLLQQR